MAEAQAASPTEAMDDGTADTNTNGHADNAPSSSSPAKKTESDLTREAAEVASSIWSRIQASGILIPPEVIDKLAELDLELSEGQSVCLIPS